MKTKIIIILCAVFVAFTAVFFWRCPLKYRATIESAAAEYGVRPALVASVIKCESGYNPRAVSKAGAKGLMQIMDATFEEICAETGLDVNGVFDPETNIAAGTYYLAKLIEKFGDEKTALAAYNAGPNRVAGWLSDRAYSKDGKTLDRAPIKQTDIYMNKVVFFKNVYKIFYLMEG